MILHMAIIHLKVLGLILVMLMMMLMQVRNLML